MARQRRASRSSGLQILIKARPGCRCAHPGYADHQFVTCAPEASMDRVPGLVARMSAATSGGRTHHPRGSPKFPSPSPISPPQSSGSTPSCTYRWNDEVRPIGHTRHKAVLHGIEMDVVDVTREVAFIANGMLPEPSLPEREIAIQAAPHRHSGSDESAAEMPLDTPPPTREVRIPRRQGEDRMEMLR